MKTLQQLIVLLLIFAGFSSLSTAAPTHDGQAQQTIATVSNDYDLATPATVFSGFEFDKLLTPAPLWDVQTHSCAIATKNFPEVMVQRTFLIAANQDFYGLYKNFSAGDPNLGARNSNATKKSGMTTGGVPMRICDYTVANSANYNPASTTWTATHDYDIGASHFFFLSNTRTLASARSFNHPLRC